MTVWINHSKKKPNNIYFTTISDTIVDSVYSFVYTCITKSNCMMAGVLLVCFFFIFSSTNAVFQRNKLACQHNWAIWTPKINLSIVPWNVECRNDIIWLLHIFWTQWGRLSIVFISFGWNGVTILDFQHDISDSNQPKLYARFYI